MWENLKRPDFGIFTFSPGNSSKSRETVGPISIFTLSVEWFNSVPLLPGFTFFRASPRRLTLWKPPFSILLERLTRSSNMKQDLRPQACPLPAGMVLLVSGEVKTVLHLIRENSHSRYMPTCDCDGCGRLGNVERTHPQPPDPQSETGTLATHSGKIEPKAL